TALVKSLTADGHTVCRLLRRESVTGTKASKQRKILASDMEWEKKLGQAAKERVLDVAWDPEASAAHAIGDPQGHTAGADAVVNLAGASIADGKWTTQRKMQLRSSRVKTTRSLVNALTRARRAPKVVVAASAGGICGSRGEEELTEESPAGKDFLATLATEWESEAMTAMQLGIRVVCTRFGIVLAKNGGALPQMMKPF